MKPPILVTGAAGFIGARFVESCNRRHQPVVSVDFLPLFAERTEHQGISFGTRIDSSEVDQWLEQTHPTLGGVVHLGAISNTAAADPAALDRWNVQASQSLWNYCRDQKLPFVYASSAATYGAGDAGFTDDESKMAELKPLNLYGQSKLKFDLWALAQERQGLHPPHWSGFKFFNVYGYGERHKGSMATAVLHTFDQIQRSGKSVLFKSHREDIADGQQARDFISVEDVVQVLHFALERPIRRGIFNLGTGQARTFLDLAHAVFAALELSPQIEYVETPLHLRAHYQYFTQATVEKLRAEGYAQPFLSLEDGVRRTVVRLFNNR